MPELLDRPVDDSHEQEDLSELSLVEWEKRAADASSESPYLGQLIDRGLELYSSIRLRANEWTRKGESANYQNLEVAKLNIRDRRGREKIVKNQIMEANMGVRSADREREEVHNMLAKLYVLAGKSPSGKTITVDQFLQASGKDFRAASMHAVKDILKKPGDTPLSTIADELRDFDPLLDDLDMDQIAFKLAKHIVEKDLGLAA